MSKKKKSYVFVAAGKPHFVFKDGSRNRGATAPGTDDSKGFLRSVTLGYPLIESDNCHFVHLDNTSSNLAWPWLVTLSLGSHHLVASISSSLKCKYRKYVFHKSGLMIRYNNALKPLVPGTSRDLDLIDYLLVFALFHSASPSTRLLPFVRCMEHTHISKIGHCLCECVRET